MIIHIYILHKTLSHLKAIKECEIKKKKKIKFYNQREWYQMFQ